MISGATRGTGGKALGTHLGKGDAELGQSRGLISSDINGQIDELTKLASRSNNSKPLYHCFARPPDGKDWDNNDFESYWDKFEKEFGLEKQPFTTADHGDHQHRVYSLVKPSGACIRMDNDHARREKIGRVIEFEKGDNLVRGAHNRAVISALELERPEIAEAMKTQGFHEGPKPVAKISPNERHQQDRTNISKANVAQITGEAWKHSDDGQSFQNALSEQGLKLAMGDKCALVVDATGSAHSLQRMLAMDARTNGHPSPKTEDIAQRIEGLELPTLHQAKQEILNPVIVNSPQPEQPTPTPPEPPTSKSEGLGSSPEASPISGPHSDTPHKPAPSPSLGGAGGGGSSHRQTTPLASMESIDGPGEAPGHNASPEERAKYLARLHAYQERREKQSQQFAKAMADASAKSLSQPSAASSGGDSNGSIQPKASTDTESPFWKAIAQARRQAAARKEFEAAIQALTEYGHNHNGSHSPEIATGQRSESSREIRESGGIAGGHDDSKGIGRTQPDSDTRGLRSNDGGRDEGNQNHDCRDKDRLGKIFEEARFKTAIAFCNVSRLQQSISELKSVSPDPLEGLGKQERFEKLKEWKSSLYDDYKNLRSSENELRKDGWKYHVSALKEETDKLKAVLAKHKGLCTREMYQEAFDVRTQMRNDLIDGLKTSSNNFNKDNTFENFLRDQSHDNPKARAVLNAMVEQKERKARIQKTLSESFADIERERDLAPAANPMDRDLRIARQMAVERAFEVYHQQQDIIKLNEERYQEIKPLRSIWPWHPINREMKEIVEENQRRHILLDAHKPKRSELDEAIHRAVSRAEQNQKQYSKWEASTGQMLDRRETLLLGIQEAIENNDPRMKSLLADGKLEEAVLLQAKREAEEQQRLDGLHKLEQGNVVHFTSRDVNASQGPGFR